ncbi:uncharacterized protein LOC128896088 [Hylaeus anthracinus]|uniref:uncharacterized protein LOC128896088 n=1 Tax=Hylaeus anthracinus TaxID=313031 RepID=UPI0023B9D6F0|nr:uncharacterized protein LOC128896088 [Hylaeus anthracinus]
MSNYGDLSQISDIHSISRISRVSCSRLMGRADSLRNIFERQCSFTRNSSRNITNLNQGTNYLQKIIRCFNQCEESISEHVKSKIILECIKEAALNVKGILSENVVNKLKGLLLIHECNKYMHMPSTSNNLHEKLTVLGIRDLPNYVLSYEEIINVKCYTETLLREKIHSFILRYDSLGGNMKEIMRSTESNVRTTLFDIHEVQMLEWKDKIEEMCSQYEVDIVKYRTLINKWKNLKYKDTNAIYLQKAEYILLQAQVAQVQAKITKLTCIMRMYKETPVTIDAYKILNAAIDEKLFVTMNEVKEKENLKKHYESLQNSEYDEVLKTYLYFCKAIKIKKQILENM